MGPTQMLLRSNLHPFKGVALLQMPVPRPLLFTTLAGLRGWRCLLSFKNTRCGVRACELVEMCVSHGRESSQPWLAYFTGA